MCAPDFSVAGRSNVSRCMIRWRWILQDSRRIQDRQESSPRRRAARLYFRRQGASDLAPSDFFATLFVVERMHYKVRANEQVELIMMAKNNPQPNTTRSNKRRSRRGMCGEKDQLIWFGAIRPNQPIKVDKLSIAKTKFNLQVKSFSFAPCFYHNVGRNRARFEWE